MKRPAKEETKDDEREKDESEITPLNYNQLPFHMRYFLGDVRFFFFFLLNIYVCQVIPYLPISQDTACSLCENVVCLGHTILPVDSPIQLQDSMLVILEWTPYGLKHVTSMCVDIGFY